MSVGRGKTVEWNGQHLVGWITIDDAPAKVSADRDMIHRHVPGFNDAVDWEIKRHCVHIFEVLAPILAAQVQPDA
jgi:hypothetical protein